jgi:pimeloyl-ACP methyl ester carboxylesterase
VYIKSVLGTVTGPIVLVGHSYGGFVITNAATGNPNVSALVYIAAYAPDENDTVQGLSMLGGGSKIGPDTLDVRAVRGPDGTDVQEALIKPSAVEIHELKDVRRGARRQVRTVTVDARPNPQGAVSPEDPGEGIDLTLRHPRAGQPQPT